MTGVLCPSHPKVIHILQDKQEKKTDLDLGSVRTDRRPKSIKLSLVHRKLTINFVFASGIVSGGIISLMQIWSLLKHFHSENETYNHKAGAERQTTNFIDQTCLTPFSKS